MATGAGSRPIPKPATPGQRYDQPGLPSRGMSRLGDYRIVKTLGEGSFGKVKRMSLYSISCPYFAVFKTLMGANWNVAVAEHQKTKQLVALKFIDRAKLSRDTNDRVEREIQYLKLLRHPHIIKLSVFLRLVY